MAVVTDSRDDLVDPSFFPKQQLAFRDIEIEGSTIVSCLGERRISAEQRLDHTCHQGPGFIVRRTVTGGLDLIVGQARRGPHQAARETVAQ